MGNCSSKPKVVVKRELVAIRTIANSTLLLQSEPIIAEDFNNRNCFYVIEMDIKDAFAKPGTKIEYLNWQTQYFPQKLLPINVIPLITTDSTFKCFCNRPDFYSLFDITFDRIKFLLKEGHIVVFPVLPQSHEKHPGQPSAGLGSLKLKERQYLVSLFYNLKTGVSRAPSGRLIIEKYPWTVKTLKDNQAMKEAAQFPLLNKFFVT